MQPEEYFDFLSPEDIRVKGTRVGIENILSEYIHNGKPPEEIVKQFYTVTLAQVYATILYYLENQETIGKYVADWVAYCLKAEAEYDKNPPAFVAQLLQLKEEKKADKKIEQFQ